MREGVQKSDGSAVEEKYYRDAIQRCPQMAEAYYNLGIVLWKQSKRDDATAAFSKALELKSDPNFKIAWAGLRLEAGESEEARRLYEEVLSEDQNNVRAMQGLSVVYEKSNEFQRAIDILTKARSTDPRNQITLYNLAVIYDKLGKNDQAVEAYEEVIARDSEHFNAHFYLGLLYQRLGRLKDAERVLSRAVASMPDRAEPHQALGVLFEQTGDLERAESAFRRVVALSTGDSASQVNLAIVLMEKKQESLA
jgi:superkiller protein 3